MSTATDFAEGASRRPRVAGTLLFPAAMVVLAVVGLVMPHIGVSRLLLSLLTQATITAILATAVGYLVRQCGLVSFGHAAFYGGSAYLVALGLHHTDLSAGLLVVGAPILIVVFAFGLAFVLLRTHGVAFSMLTLAIAQGCHELVMRWRDLANGEDGIAARFPRDLLGIPTSLFQRPDSMFVICWLTLFAVLTILWLISRSHLGTLTLAIQNNEERCRFIGYETLLPRAFLIAISAAVAAIGGLLFVLYNGFVSPSVLHWSLSGEALAIAIIGGTRQVWGPALGALVFFFIRDAAGTYTSHWPAIVGGLLVIVTVMLPGGLSGACVRIWDRVRRANG